MRNHLYWLHIWILFLGSCLLLEIFDFGMDWNHRIQFNIHNTLQTCQFFHFLPSHFYKLWKSLRIHKMRRYKLSLLQKFEMRRFHPLIHCIINYFAPYFFLQAFLLPPSCLNLSLSLFIFIHHFQVIAFILFLSRKFLWKIYNFVFYLLL